MTSSSHPPGGLHRRPGKAGSAVTLEKGITLEMSRLFCLGLCAETYPTQATEVWASPGRQGRPREVLAPQATQGGVK